MQSIQTTAENFSGLTLKQLAAKCRKQAKDSDGCHNPIHLADGLSAVWVANPNYQGGRKNGYGAGCYARIGKVGFVKTELLAY